MDSIAGISRTDDLVEMAGRIARREVGAVELTTSLLAAIEGLNPSLNAYITVMADDALAEARAADRDIGAGRYRGPLHGVPMSLKDLFWTRGVRTTAGSRVLANFVPTEDAAVVQRLRDAGAVLVAKANMMEFAYAAAHPDFGPTRNPWDLTKTTSGSSGGSAAAVAGRLDFGSIGSDTGGSVRIPSSFCGVTGLKPTYGRVSRHGMAPLSPTLDHAGPFGRSARDVAIVLGAIAGYDPRDPGSADVPTTDYFQALDGRLDHVRIGLATNFLDSSVAEDIRGAITGALDAFRDAGAAVEEIEISELEGDTIQRYMNVLLPEASHVHREWLGEHDEEYTPSTLERLLAGRQISAVDYLDALEARQRLRARVRERQRVVDLLILPSSPSVATPIEATTIEVSQDDQTLTNFVRMTAPFDLTGQPALSLPCGFTEGGLPIGMQIVGRDFEDGLVLRAGHAFQVRTDWHRRLPELVRRSISTG